MFIYANLRGYAKQAQGSPVPPPDCSTNLKSYHYSS